MYEQQDDAGKPRLWVAWLDHRFAPRQISSEPEERSPLVTPSGKIYFRYSDGGAYYLYRMNADGTNREKALNDPIIVFYDVSPDERYVAIRTTLVGEDNPTAVDWFRSLLWMVFSTVGARRQSLIFPSAAHAGKFANSHFCHSLSHGEDVPQFPAKGIEAEADIPTRAALQAIDQTIIAGPNSSLYSFGKLNEHWYLYRIPLP